MTRKVPGIFLSDLASKVIRHPRSQFTIPSLEFLCRRGSWTMSICWRTRRKVGMTNEISAFIGSWVIKIHYSTWDILSSLWYNDRKCCTINTWYIICSYIGWKLRENVLLMQCAGCNQTWSAGWWKSMACEVWLQSWLPPGQETWQGRLVYSLPSRGLTYPTWGNEHYLPSYLW